MLFKPMLAAKLTPKDLQGLRFPLLASPKLDGVRCLIQNGSAWSRNLKPIPNEELRARLSELPDGLDGELVIPGGTFCDVTSAVMSKTGNATRVEYWVFDRVAGGLFVPFRDRLEDMLRAVSAVPGDWVRAIPQLEVHDLGMLDRLERRWVLEGYEGIILRAAEAGYKLGRSTVKEQGLLKLKRFSDAEAEVVGYVEQMHNENEAKRDEVGRMKRSSAKAGKSRAGVLGALKVRDLRSGVVFEIGTGFTAEQRSLYWEARRGLIGRLAKYSFQSSGAKDKPRFPVFIGFRAVEDMP